MRSAAGGTVPWDQPYQEPQSLVLGRFEKGGWGGMESKVASCAILGAHFAHGSNFLEMRILHVQLVAKKGEAEGISALSLSGVHDKMRCRDGRSVGLVSTRDLRALRLPPTIMSHTPSRSRVGEVDHFPRKSIRDVSYLLCKIIGRPMPTANPDCRSRQGAP